MAAATQVQTDHHIALGVLMWIIATADKQFLTEELEQIERTLRETCGLGEEDLKIVLEAVKVAAEERIDVFEFTRELVGAFSRESCLAIFRDLFRVALADRSFDAREEALLRKISGLLQLRHEDFIQTKIIVKKEFGLPTVE